MSMMTITSQCRTLALIGLLGIGLLLQGCNTLSGITGGSGAGSSAGAGTAPEPATAKPRIALALVVAQHAASRISV